MKEILLNDSFKLIDGDVTLAEIDFPYIENNIICITHTFVSDTLRGQGIASKLVEKVIEIAKEKNLKVKASCSYAISYFSKHECELYISD